jgi:type II secretory pathway component PulM
MRDKLLEFWKQRSSRERVILAAASAVLAFMVIYPAVIAPIQEAFSAQSQRLADIRTTFNVTPDILSRYAALSARKKDVEAFYTQTDLSSNPLSYLESLLKERAKADGTYNVSTPKEAVPLGGKYLHRFFAVNFQTSSYENLTEFLKALTTGKQPMLVSQINLDKRSGAEMLNVQLEVSGFELLSK